MRAAATVVRLMPSPRNRITFFARPCIAPFAAARAAPLRYHQAAVSPCGCATSGTSIAPTGRPSPEAGVASRTLPLHAARRVARQASGNKRIRGFRQGRAHHYAVRARHAPYVGRCIAPAARHQYRPRDIVRDRFVPRILHDEIDLRLVQDPVLAARRRRLRARCARRLAAGAGGGDLVQAARRHLRHPDPHDRHAAGVLRGGRCDLQPARAEVGGRAWRTHLRVVRGHRRARGLRRPAGRHRAATRRGHQRTHRGFRLRGQGGAGADTGAGRRGAGQSIQGAGRRQDPAGDLLRCAARLRACGCCWAKAARR